ncbi:hypothetical protein SDC9_111430 [bioreactor metagenome]|uniref:Folate transporter FolT n=1 Tax=bioreactor metagenome TaxID=1076179 RepID=A0A645BMN1_9ZZZZ
MDQKLFASPLSPAYWRASGRELSRLRVLTLAAMLLALRIVISAVRIPVADNLNIMFTYLPESLIALICGPVAAPMVGAAGDILGYLMHPDGGFFPGYTLSAMLTGLIYALFLYRARITVLRIALAKLLVNYGVNVLLGSLWSSVMYGKGYLYYFAKSAVKNTIMLPVEIIILTLVLSILLPVLSRSGITPPQTDRRLRVF